MVFGTIKKMVEFLIDYVRFHHDCLTVVGILVINIIYFAFIFAFADWEVKFLKEIKGCVK